MRVVLLSDHETAGGAGSGCQSLGTGFGPNRYRNHTRGASFRPQRVSLGNPGSPTELARAGHSKSARESLKASVDVRCWPDHGPKLGDCSKYCNQMSLIFIIYTLLSGNLVWPRFVLATPRQSGRYTTCGALQDVVSTAMTVESSSRGVMPLVQPRQSTLC